MRQKLVHHDGDSKNVRTPFDEAIKQILQHLIETRKSYSITGLAREIGLHRNTVQKSIELLDILEKKWLDDYRISLQEVDNKRFIRIERRTGLLSYPEELQKLIITGKYYPTYSEEEYLLVFLYLRHATTSNKSILLPNRGKHNEEMITKLVKQGQMKENKEGRLYLTDEGVIVAKGALKIYPSLADANTI